MDYVESVFRYLLLQRRLKKFQHKEWIQESYLYRFAALWMPPAISRKEDRFQSYRFGYHEVAPSLDGLCRKRISLSIIAKAIKKIPT